MSQQAVVLKRDQGEILSVMGAAVKFLCTSEKTDKAWSLMEVTVPKRSGPPPHKHPWGEAYYIIEGSVRFSLDGEEQIVGTGDFLYAPADTVHGFSGESESPARMLIFDAPAHAESFFRDVEREVKNMPADFAKVPAIGARHQIHFLTPKP